MAGARAPGKLRLRSVRGPGRRRPQKFARRCGSKNGIHPGERERERHSRQSDRRKPLTLLTQLRHLPLSHRSAAPPPELPRCSAAGRPTRTARAWAPPWAGQGQSCRGRHRAWPHRRRPRRRRRRRACTAGPPPRRARTRCRGRARRERGRCRPHLVRFRVRVRVGVGVRVNQAAGQALDEEKAVRTRTERTDCAARHELWRP